ncbi:34-kDa subunit of RNA polymerase III (C) [Pleurotus pulmonarius]|nr:34-kDa subunit of RNA polymerase III (C) [Pleurotus pulmonarius]KAF4600820.1 34-kDa subunit of RNA polymerase III (C) [Pleurotus pulmonarius]
MSRRGPSEAEGTIHQAALAAPKQELTIKQVEALVPDAKARQKALNALLARGFIKALQSSSGLSFRALSKNELNATKDLTAEEVLVYSHIQGSKNEGIWTKQLKAKTNLHQTVIDRCLKTLTQKAMIKRVPSVQHPTRKIYMLEGLEPSIALTGGPWYTDNEFDTEFIKLLKSASLRFIQEQSFPKRRSSSQSQQPVLYSISKAPEYPTAQNVRTFLKQSRITETDLSVEHIEMLLNVLVLDGEIEKLPAFGATLWDSNVINDDASSDERSSKKKRKNAHESDSDSDSRSSKSKRKKRGSKDDDRSKSKRSKSKKRHREDDSGDESEPSHSKKKKKTKVKTESASESESSDDAKQRRKKPKKKSKKHESSGSETESSEASDSASESESEFDSAKSKKRKASKSRDRSSSPVDFNSFDDFAGGANIYRAIKQEKMALGWSQAPCGNCLSFDFCKEGGPVNPRECVYYSDFLLQPVGGMNIEEMEGLITEW